MKIAYVGDSFCAHAGPGTPVNEDPELAMKLGKKYNIDMGGSAIPPDNDKYDWPYLVTKHFNAEPTYCGIMGVNFYHSFESFLQNTKNEDYIVICVSEAFRIINKYKLPMNKPWLEEITTQTNLGKWMLEYYVGEPDSLRHKGLNKEKMMEIAVNAKYYKDNIMDFDAIVAMSNAFLMYVDNMMVEKGKKCLWFNSFPEFKLDWMKPFIPRSGPIGDQDLFSIVSVIKGIDYIDPLARNHFTRDLNITMSKMVIDIIENNYFQPGKFPMDVWFPVDENVKNDKFHYLRKILDAKDLDAVDGFIYP